MPDHQQLLLGLRHWLFVSYGINSFFCSRALSVASPYDAEHIQQRSEHSSRVFIVVIVFYTLQV